MQFAEFQELTHSGALTELAAYASELIPPWIGRDGSHRSPGATATPRTLVLDQLVLSLLFEWIESILLFFAYVH